MHAIMSRRLRFVLSCDSQQLILTPLFQVRFESQPNVYKSFLRILHTFHEEHNTINNVYDQVAVLFKNHADLLREFKQFLPDTTQSSPRTRRAKSVSFSFCAIIIVFSFH